MSCLKLVKEFDKDQLELCGAQFCQFFGDISLEKHFRVDLKSSKLKEEIIRAVVNDGLEFHELGSPDGFISPKYWMKILDKLDSKYTYKRASIKSKLDWKSIARYFLKYIASKPENMHTEWLEGFLTQIKKIMVQKNFRKIEELINFVTTSDNPSTTQDVSSPISLIELQSSQNHQQKIDTESTVTSIAQQNEDEKNIQNDDENNNKDNDRLATTTIEMVQDSKEDSDDLNSEIQPTSSAVGSSKMDCTQNSPSIEQFDRKLMEKDEHSCSTPDAEETEDDSDLEPPVKIAKIKLDRVLNVGQGPPKKIKLTKITRLSVLEDNSSDSFQTIPDSESIESDSTILSMNDDNRFDKSKGKSYRDDEDLNILRYIIRKRRFTDIKGIQLWKDMEDDKVCPTRSWQSMKERFRRTICPKIFFYQKLYNLKESDVDAIQTYGFNSDSTKKQNVTDEYKNLTKLNYTTEEDHEIIKFIIESLGKEKILGNKLWMKLAKHFKVNLQKDRSWQSLKDRFKQRILPFIWRYQIEEYKYEQIMKLLEECSNSLKNLEELNKNVATKFKKTLT